MTFSTPRWCWRLLLWSGAGERPWRERLGFSALVTVTQDVPGAKPQEHVYKLLCVVKLGSQNLFDLRQPVAKCIGMDVETLRGPTGGTLFIKVDLERIHPVSYTHLRAH